MPIPGYNPHYLRHLYFECRKESFKSETIPKLERLTTPFLSSKLLAIDTYRHGGLVSLPSCSVPFVDSSHQRSYEARRALKIHRVGLNGKTLPIQFAAAPLPESDVSSSTFHWDTPYSSHRPGHENEERTHIWNALPSQTAQPAKSVKQSQILKLHQDRIQNAKPESSAAHFNNLFAEDWQSSIGGDVRSGKAGYSSGPFYVTIPAYDNYTFSAPNSAQPYPTAYQFKFASPLPPTQDKLSGVRYRNAANSAPLRSRKPPK